MKTSTLLIASVILFLGSLSFSSTAQEEEMPTMFAVFEEFVSPADMTKFSEVQNQTFAEMEKYDANFTFWGYRTDENVFYWVLPMMNFASLDNFFKESMALQKKMKEDGFDPNKKFRDLSTMRSSIIYWNKELSYHPGGEMGQTKEKPYCEWTFCYLRNGHDADAANAVKKYIEFYNSIDESFEWDIYQVIFGHDTPCWIIMSRAENEIAARKLENDLNSKYKEDFQKMWQNFAQHVRKVEHTRGWFLPKWSMNLPE